MRQRLSLFLTLAAWLFATGSHWDLVQTFAWGRMIADYSQEMTLAQAVQKTFSAETMCPICHAVANAKQSSETGDSALPPPKSPGKILLVCAPSPFLDASPASYSAGLTPDVAAPLSADRSAPPRPPPRALA